MRLIIAEKRALIAPLNRAGLLSVDDQITFTFSLGPWIESPEKITFNQIPYTGYSGKMRSLHEAASEADGELWRTKKAFVVDHNDSPILTLSTSTEGLEEWVAFLNEQLPHYSEIIIATDSDRRGAYGALQILERLNTPRPPVHVMLFSSTSNDSLAKAWVNRKNTPWEASGQAANAKAQKIKRLFEFWWQSNSALVFGELCKKAGLKGNPAISKYEFMTMSILHSHDEPMTRSQLLSIMERWEGTGAFAKQNVAEYECKIGSPSSRLNLMSRLSERGFVTIALDDNRPQQKRLEVTPEGRVFMSLCHPKTFDPDLPSRLWVWARDSNTTSMRRYINTVFSRQLRFQRKNTG